MKQRDQSKKILCTVWTHPSADMALILPGNKKETRKIAREHIGGNPRLLKGVEELWSNNQLKDLREYES